MLPGRKKTVKVGFAFHADFSLKVQGVDLKNMGLKDFILQPRKLTKERCTDVYYCLQIRSVIDGLKELRDDNDYVRFLDARYVNDCKINVYIDEYQEPVMEWIDEEKVEEGDTESDEYEDDVDSVMSDYISVDPL
ncbi:unnamed protein product [Lactuca saligna]|uniref:Uncharacterized protein n=1 Tax=Lactuca saligna TaxID=75948 RepID=A0AA35YQY3_LACSI|nr:unnamed protein product [Lactuca saligna]